MRFASSKLYYGNGKILPLNLKIYENEIETLRKRNSEKKKCLFIGNLYLRKRNSENIIKIFTAEIFLRKRNSKHYGLYFHDAVLMTKKRAF